MPTNIDLNVSLSFFEGDEHIVHRSESDVNTGSIVEQYLLSGGKLVFDLNIAPSEIPFDTPTELVEEKENETELVEEVEHDFETPNELVELREFETEVEQTDHAELLTEIDRELDTPTEYVELHDFEREVEHEFNTPTSPVKFHGFETEFGHDFDTPIEHVEVHDSQPILSSNGRCGRRKFLSNEDRKVISHLLLQHCCDGKLKKGTIKSIASLFSVSIGVIKSIWRKTKDTGDVSHRKTKNCGRKRVQLNDDQFRQVPLSRRTTLRDLVVALNINKTSLIRLQKKGCIRRQSNAIKPFLKEENKIARIKFCCSMLESATMPHDPTFKTMHNIVHIDEKWFYMTKKSIHYYLLPEEEEPLRTCKSKNFIGKVMFLVAMARPRFDAKGNETFSGKIGVFPFITTKAAKRSSVNRAAGTLETKPITSVNKEISRMFLIEKVVPAIKEKWPADEVGDPIFIQQDNARCHIQDNDSEFCRVSKEDGFDIRLMSQPPNSPDLNVLDLGFFNSIQALQHKEALRTIDELVGAVVKSFETFSSVESNKIFLTLQTCMIEIMKARGSNKYNIPHIKKAVMQKEGQLPTQIKCDPSLVEEVIQHLRSV